MTTSVLPRLPVFCAYLLIVLCHMGTAKRLPHKFKIARIPQAYLYGGFPAAGLDLANFDDGLIHIGRHYCFNHDQPRCEQCPIGRYCEGYQSNPRLITDYRT